MIENNYDFFDDVNSILEELKPKPKIEPQELALRRAKLHTIGEGLRTIGEFVGGIKGAHIEKRNPSNEIFKSLDEFNRLKAEEKADDVAWRNKLLEAKLREGAAKASLAKQITTLEEQARKHQADIDFKEKDLDLKQQRADDAKAAIDEKNRIAAGREVRLREEGKKRAEAKEKDAAIREAGQELFPFGITVKLKNGQEYKLTKAQIDIILKDMMEIEVQPKAYRNFRALIEYKNGKLPNIKQHSATFKGLIAMMFGQNEDNYMGTTTQQQPSFWDMSIFPQQNQPQQPGYGVLLNPEDKQGKATQQIDTPQTKEEKGENQSLITKVIDNSEYLNALKGIEKKDRPKYFKDHMYPVLKEKGYTIEEIKKIAEDFKNL